uniref:Uncharacterized protein n=3 Tax=Oryza sativa subsp. japonica TaxID=39947 RepID=Q75K75_ORYSJ|nr:hypothetical protein [Oryza sativa Japonica Group]
MRAKRGDGGWSADASELRNRRGDGACWRRSARGVQRSTAAWGPRLADAVEDEQEGVYNLLLLVVMDDDGGSLLLVAASLLLVCGFNSLALDLAACLWIWICSLLADEDALVADGRADGMTRPTDGGSPATDACCLTPAIPTAEVRVLLLLEPIAIVVVVFSGVGIGIGIVVVFSSGVGMRRLRRRRAPRLGCVWGECGMRVFATSAAEVEVEGSSNSSEEG